MSKVNLKDLTPDELVAFVRELGEPAFRARQLLRWIYTARETDFERMTNLSLKLRSRLQEKAEIPELQLKEERHSEQETTKYLFTLPDGEVIESVRMHYLGDDVGPGRVAVCISTQVGCAMACDFCASGKLGLRRNLATWEIVDQVLQIQKRLDEQGERVANVVFMGIGEPLHNYRNTLRAVRMINSPEGLGIGMRHLTVSTAGLVPRIRELAAEKLPLRLAISLHATNDELREKIMPVNRKWKLDSLLEACRDYQEATGRRVTFEYVLLDGINDSVEEAHELVRLLSGMHSLVNLIPWNPIEGVPYKRSRPARVRAFQEVVEKSGIKCTVRQEKGSDIAAACGQLRLSDLKPA